MTQIATNWIEDSAVDKDKLNADVAGDGVSGGAGSALAVDPYSGADASIAPLSVDADGAGVDTDDSTMTHTAGVIQIKDGGVDTTQLANDAVDGDKLDTSATFDFNTGGGTVQVGTPSGDNDAASKSYVDNVAAGLKWKLPAKVVNTGTEIGSLSGLTHTIDSISSFSDGDRVLLTSQTTDAAENGLWVMHTGAWTRPDDFDTGEPAANAACFVEQGGSYADTMWVCTNDSGSDVIDTDDLAFVQFGASTSYTWGAGLDNTGNTVFVGDANKGVQVNTDDVEVDGSEIAGNGIAQNGTNTWQIDVDPYSGGDTSVAPVTVDANGVGVDTDDDTITHSAGVLAVKADGIGATELDETDSYDFSASGSVDVATQTTGDNTTKAASTAFVQQEIAGMSTETTKQEMHLVTAGEVTAGYFTLASTPENAQGVRIDPVKGPRQVNKQVVGATGVTPDFDVNQEGGTLADISFNNNGGATGLSGDIKANDVLIITYAI